MSDTASDLIATYEMLLESHGGRAVVVQIAGMDDTLTVHKLEQGHGEFVIVHSTKGRTVALANTVVLHFTT